MRITDPAEIVCNIERALTLFRDRWSLLILREAAGGATRFGVFRRRLGIASDVLAARLAELVAAGVLERVAYREPGERERAEYRLTDAGRDATVVLGALGDWGRRHMPVDLPTAPPRFVDGTTGEQVRVAFVDAAGRALPPEAVALRAA